MLPTQNEAAVPGMDADDDTRPTFAPTKYTGEKKRRMTYLQVVSTLQAERHLIAELLTQPSPHAAKKGDTRVSTVMAPSGGRKATNPKESTACVETHT